MSINFYNIYGLIIKSSIHIHDYLQLNNHLNNYDVEIKLSKISIPDNIKTINKGIFKFSNNFTYFNIDNVAQYKVIKGNIILVDPYPNSNMNEVVKFIMGSALGLLLFKRNIIAIHGGALTRNNNGIIISGNIGSGKTTTIANLIKKGYRFLSDDVSSIIKNKNGIYHVYNCIPQQKLCKNTAEQFGYKIDKLYKIDKIKDKYLSPNIPNFTTSPQELKFLFYLDICNNSNNKVTCEEINGIDKFNIIFSNIFRKEYIPIEFINGTYIKECLNLANSISVYKINRPQHVNSINEIASTIEYICK